MRVNIEKEYKILVTQTQFECLLAHYPQAVFRKQVNTYYDTINNDLRRVRGAMRIREINDQYIFTLKMVTDQGLIEHEMFVNGNHVDVFNHPDIQALFSKYRLSLPVHETARLTTHRAVIANDDAELCFDYNTYGDHHDFEIEYEYKREHDGLSAFQAILRPANITYHENCASKLRRALDHL